MLPCERNGPTKSNSSWPTDFQTSLLHQPHKAKIAGLQTTPTACTGVALGHDIDWKG